MERGGGGADEAAETVAAAFEVGGCCVFDWAVALDGAGYAFGLEWN